jgi:hypothetical protein
MSLRRRRTTQVLAAIAVAIAFPLAASAGAASDSGTKRGLSLDDATYYVDVGDAVPPSFRQLSTDEITTITGGRLPDGAIAAYLAEDPGEALFLHLTVGKGRSAGAVFEYAVRHADQDYSPDDLVGLLTDQDVPADQVSIEPAQWADVSVGDAARSAVFNVDIAGEGTLHFEELVMFVRSGDDAALVELAHAFLSAPSVDIAAIAGAVAQKVRTGPPTPERTIAEAGVITRGDLPSSWQQAADEPTTGTASTRTADEKSAVDDEVVRIARRIPACKAFVGLIAGSESGGTASRATNGKFAGTFSLDGPRFRLGLATVTSEVSVHANAAVASGMFAALREPSTKACLTKLYAKAAKSAIETSGQRLSPTARRQLQRVRVSVTTPRASAVGDDRVVFRVAADLRPVRNVRIVSEQEFVKVGRATAVYTFSSTDTDSVREDVVRAVTDRLAGAPGVH